MTEQPFQVDLRGIVDLLSRHLYSSPQVYVRELLQNGRDAIAARKSADPHAPTGVIRVSAGGGIVTFRDNGIGLTQAEATELLSTVGRSSKRDAVLGLRREEYLGQFGIGLLSCFLVADEILVKSQAAAGGPAIKWVGSADGTFAIGELDEAHPVGTTVELRVRPDDGALASAETVKGLLTRFGEFLPDQIIFAESDGAGTPLTRPAPFLDFGSAETLDYGTALLGEEPLAVIPLVVPGTKTVGVGYALPFSPPPHGRQAHRVYLGRMLLGEQVPDLLPDWAFFVRCVINTDGLSPTASRETLVDNLDLAATRETLGTLLREWIVDLADSDPRAFAVFIAVHQLALKSMAIYDDELARVLLPHIVVQTSIGSVTIAELIGRGEVRYCETVDEFRQIAAVVPEDEPLVNGGYTLDSSLLRRLPQVFPEVKTRQVGVHEALAQLRDVAEPSSKALAIRAAEALGPAACAVSVKYIEPANMPALYVADPAALRRLERGQARDAASAMWASVLDQVDEIVAETHGSAPEPELCLNWSNQLVRELAQVGDSLVFERSIRLIYIQALLAGHHPLKSTDRTSLTSALSDLVQLSIFREHAE